jgi:hypothetical protein
MHGEQESADWVFAETLADFIALAEALPPEVWQVAVAATVDEAVCAGSLSADIAQQARAIHGRLRRAGAVRVLCRLLTAAQELLPATATKAHRLIWIVRRKMRRASAKSRALFRFSTLLGYHIGRPSAAFHLIAAASGFVRQSIRPRSRHALGDNPLLLRRPTRRELAEF